MNVFDLYKRLCENPNNFVKVAQQGGGSSPGGNTTGPEYLTPTEVKIPTNVANVLAGVLLGLLATHYFSGKRDLDISTALTGGGIGGILGLLGPELYKERLGPTLSTILGLKEENKPGAKTT